MNAHRAAQPDVIGAVHPGRRRLRGGRRSPDCSFSEERMVQPLVRRRLRDGRARRSTSYLLAVAYPAAAAGSGFRKPIAATPGERRLAPVRQRDMGI